MAVSSKVLIPGRAPNRVVFSQLGLHSRGTSIQMHSPIRTILMLGE